MYILSALLFAITANIDNFAIGIAYGVKNIKIRWQNNVFIATINTLGTCFAMFCGKYISHYISNWWTGFLGCGILLIIGVWFIIQFWVQVSYNRSIYPHQRYLDFVDGIQSYFRADFIWLNFRETVILALTLSCNNFAVAMGGSFIGLHMGWVCGLSFILSLLFLSIGSYIGRSCFSKIFGIYANLVSGCIIVFLGIHEFLGRLS